MERKEESKIIIAVYQDSGKKIHLGVSPDLNNFTNGKEYFIDLEESLLKISIENIEKANVKKGQNE